MGGWLSRGWILDQREAPMTDRITTIVGGPGVKSQTGIRESDPVIATRSDKRLARVGR